jgi:MoaA/NifB/PqqE/SkfB family radical SAM enzyme
LPQKDSLNTEKLKKILSEMKKCGIRRVQFTGGEPMMREDLGEVISYSKKLGFFVGLSTNGHQIAERIEELKGVDIVFLSYDGPGKAHISLRGEQNLKEVYSALRALKKVGIRVWTTTVLTKKNKDSVDEIVNFAKENKILANFNRLEFVSNPGPFLHPFYENIKELALSTEERRDVFRRLIDLKYSGAPVGCSFSYLRSVLEWPYNNRITDSNPAKRYRCWAGIANGHIEADGRLYSCGWDALRGKIGMNVLDKGFRFAWDNLPLSNDCQSCSHACGVENNLIFSLNPSSIWNAFKKLSF